MIMSSNGSLLRLCCVAASVLAIAASESSFSSSSSSSLEIIPSSFSSSTDNNNEQAMQPLLVDTSPDHDTATSAASDSTTALDAGLLLAAPSSRATTTTTSTTTDFVDMVKIWPFHKKNKTSSNNTEPAVHNKTRDETCAAQRDCSACAVHSHMCHWCAHDNACHSIGSIYGCITGVNCFSNDRCKRQSPDPMNNSSTYAKMKILPLIVAVVVAGLAFLCVTFGYCLACGIKGAYDDLAEIAAMESRPFVFPVHAFTTVDTSMTQPAAAATSTAAEAAVADQEAETQEEGHVPPNTTAFNGASNANYMRLADGEDEAETSPLLQLTSQAPESRRIPRHMQRCFNACTLCYVATVAILGTLVFGTVHYYPKIPQYSVCSDQVAWKSLIDSIAAIKVDASFEILVSVANPNVVDAVLDIGKGTFKHNNAFVGTFEIPPARVPAMSISDVMIIARFTPEKYEALAIVEEYYRGKLILHIDAQASIRVPYLFNYTYEVEVKDMIVNANEKDDRTLCKCPTWDDVRNNTKVMSLTLPSKLFQS